MKGRSNELTAGGLIRSAGRRRAVEEAYRHRIPLDSHERNPGTSDFVETTLKEAGEAHDRRIRLRSDGMDLSAVIGAV